MEVSETIAVVSPDTFKRPILASNAIQAVQSTYPWKVIAVRAAASFPLAPKAIRLSVEHVSAAADPGLSSFVEKRLQKVSLSTPAMRQTTGRSARTARSWHLMFALRSASPAPFSTLRA
ncbi:hypothetical protein X753_32025 [Mesorhizobium sp. LNJC399B00]|nr:hypothetical protein X753_32025 [Mesorhizobium sp. LNJC399B00]